MLEKLKFRIPFHHLLTDRYDSILEHKFDTQVKGVRSQASDYILY